MHITEVVEATHHVHACRQGRLLLDQVARAPRQPRQPLAERCIQPFNVSGIDDATALGALEQLCHQRFSALDHPAHDVQAPRLPADFANKPRLPKPCSSDALRAVLRRGGAGS